MNKLVNQLAVFVVFLLLAPVFSVNVMADGLADSPWPCFHRDARHSGQSPYAGPASGTLKWKYQTGNSVYYSSPAIGADGTVYVGSCDNYVYALNPGGSLKWRYQTGNQVRSSPAIAADGTVYVGSGDNYVYALNPDGSLKWRYQTGDWVGSSPAIGPDGTVYVGSYDHYVYALNSADGSLIWRYLTNDRVYSSPAIGSEGTVYVGSADCYVYALNPAGGSLKWKYLTGSTVYFSSPAIGSDGTVYVGSYDHFVYALNPDGSLKWRYQTGHQVTSSPAIGSDGTVYVGSDDYYVYALNSADGSLKWKFQTEYPVESSPVIGADGTLYIGSGDNYVYALNSADGNLKWKYLTGDYVGSSPAIGSDGTLYVGSDDNYVYAFNQMAAPPNPIPDTGQTQCYDDAGNIISCPNPGEPYYGQDAQYEGLQPSYTKLGQDGVALPDSATVADGWIMTKDNVTGLVWEIKQNMDDNPDYENPHDADNTYTWYDGNPNTNGGNAGTPGDGVSSFDTEQFIDQLNAEGFGGFSDWRMPTVKEISRLVDNSIPYPGPTIKISFFSSTKAHAYWSSDTNAGLINSAFFEYFDRGGSSNTYKNSGFYVRAVRGGQPASADYLIDNGDGTVTDTATGLMWQQATAPGTYNWQQALSYAENLALAGYDDWRLPNRNELQSIVDYKTYNPGIDQSFFPDTFAYGYWSSTTDALHKNGARYVYFYNGYVYYENKPTGLYVRAVRGGPAETMQYTVTFTAGANGTIDPADAQVVEHNGSTAPVTAIPAAGYSFVNWTGTNGFTSTENPLTVTSVTSDLSVSANFAADVFMISGTVTGGAGPLAGVSVTFSHDGQTVVTDEAGQYSYYGVSYGTATTVTPIRAGYVFDPPDRLLGNVTANQTVNFTGALRTYTISGSAGVGGTISPSGPVAVDHGSDRVFTIAPNTGYHVADVVVDGISVGALTVYTFTNVTAAHTITADFAINIENQPPAVSSPVGPIHNAVLTPGAVELKSGPYSDPEGDPQTLSRWQVRRIDEAGSWFIDKCSETDLTCCVITSGLESGQCYAWRVGHADAGSGRITWSAEGTFLVGEVTIDKRVPPVVPGIRVSDYRMISFVQWPKNANAGSVLGPLMNTAYDKNYMVGTYDPTLNGIGGYREYPDFEVAPGHSYWFLARYGMDFTINGVPVSTSTDINVSLRYNAVNKNGWNMIACPNNGRYYWGDIEIIERDADGNVVYGPMPIRQLAAGNPCIETRIWDWTGGAYSASSSMEFILSPYSGYWIKAKKANLSLVFPYEMILVGASPERGLAGLYARAKAWVVDTMTKPDTAVADVGGESPPMPMSGLDGQLPDGAGGGGNFCFVSIVANSPDRVAGR